jgi:FkbM family methyltransferase
MASQAAPQATIHSFEVISATYSKLVDQCKTLNHITAHNMGLSDADGTIEFSVAPENDTLSSALPGLHGEFHKFEHYKESCPVTRGDQFCAQHDIRYIDFLKIDVEGLESKVISGFSKMLGEKRIGAIQFEYGQINLRARVFLEDYYNLLRPFGMRLGKIYPDYVDFKNYHFTQDDLAGPNYLAVDEKRSDYIIAVGGAV